MITPDELAWRVALDDETLIGDVPVLLVDLAAAAAGPTADAVAALPAVIVGLGGEASWCDVTTDDRAVAAAIVHNATATPLAAVSLALLLRGRDGRTNAESLVAESATYSLLQAGPEFAAWRAAATHSPVPDPAPPVRCTRDGSTLQIVLHRPHRHNAYSVAMRDLLVEALRVAAADPDLRVVLSGEGPSFCSGGDLGEFGTFADPASAHAVRLTRSAARLMAVLAPRVEAHVHGACLGAGVELPAFAGRVVAHPEAVFGLPELALGLVPGAGGTASLPARIGRQRTARLALTGERIDAPTALEWGLVDEIS